MAVRPWGRGPDVSGHAALNCNIAKRAGEGAFKAGIGALDIHCPARLAPANPTVMDDIHDDFQAHGVQAIEAMRTNDPGAYVKVVASLLPKDIHITEKRLVELTDAEILAQLSGVLAVRKLDDDIDKSVVN